MCIWLKFSALTRKKRYSAFLDCSLLFKHDYLYSVPQIELARVEESLLLNSRQKEKITIHKLYISCQ